MKTSPIILFALVAATAHAAVAKPLTMIFGHGLVDTHEQAYRWQQAHPHLHAGPIIARNFPDADKPRCGVFPWTSMGQGNEIATLKETVDTFQHDYPGKEIILSGLSRGAATVINYAALHQPQDVKALILISPFPSMRLVVQNLIKTSWLNDIPYAYELSPYLAGCVFWQYSDGGIHPIDVITQIDQKIPILFISLEHDHLIPSHLTQLLVDKLKENGHTRVHHLKLHDGRHGKPIPGEEGEKMQRVIQAFYYYYNLPCDAECAKHGMQEFLLT